MSDVDEKIKFDGYSLIKRNRTWQLYVGKDLTGKVIRKSLNTSDKGTAILRGREYYDETLAEFSATMSVKKSFKANAEDFMAYSGNKNHKIYMNRCFIPYNRDFYTLLHKFASTTRFLITLAQRSCKSLYLGYFSYTFLHT